MKHGEAVEWPGHRVGGRAAVVGVAEQLTARRTGGHVRVPLRSVLQRRRRRQRQIDDAVDAGTAAAPAAAGVGSRCCCCRRRRHSFFVQYLFQRRLADRHRRRRRHCGRRRKRPEASLRALLPVQQAEAADDGHVEQQQAGADGRDQANHGREAPRSRPIDVVLASSSSSSFSSFFSGQAFFLLDISLHQRR